MTLILQFLDLDKYVMVYVEVTNVPSPSLYHFLRSDWSDPLLVYVFNRLTDQFGACNYLLYGVINGRRMRRKLLCSYDYMDWAQASSNV